MRHFNYGGLSPTGLEAVEEMRAVSDEFHALLLSESGIAWYRKQVENCRQKVAQLLHVNLFDQSGSNTGGGGRRDDESGWKIWWAV